MYDIFTAPGVAIMLPREDFDVTRYVISQQIGFYPVKPHKLAVFLHLALTIDRNGIMGGCGAKKSYTNLNFPSDI